MIIAITVMGLWFMLLLVAGLAILDIQQTHKRLYDELGRPSAFVSSSTGFSFLFGFVLMGEYRGKVSELGLRRKLVVIQSLLFVIIALVTVGLAVAPFLAEP